ncbi:acyl-CoA N-acyltransferase [Schizopora paradoxa]|uniref:Acyl-CoA N-acyltransferase n=1 Tax=Schizopora paradoxa TaxID=27342 RepID=A0A0H2S6B8_9AGAM|nr:acyl-CoA N-acyltransferase [Schizopora paradoxa]
MSCNGNGLPLSDRASHVNALSIQLSCPSILGSSCICIARSIGVTSGFDMTWCNNYTPPPPKKLEDIFGPDPYDVNFCYPIDLKLLENERVKLTPFVPKYHAAPFVERAATHPHNFRYISISPPSTVEELCTFLESVFRANPGFVWFAIFDKTKPSDEFADAPPEVGGGGSFAGCIGVINTSDVNLSSELGYVMIFPEFQRTHVLSNAAGLLLHYLLDLPTDVAFPGLGLRRVQWVAHIQNAPSVAAAERLGFKREGTLRWHWTLPEGKEGKATREGDPLGPSRLGRDNVFLSICCDDWESGTKERVRSLMDRRN